MYLGTKRIKDVQQINCHEVLHTSMLWIVIKGKNFSIGKFEDNEVCIMILFITRMRNPLAAMNFCHRKI